ncbi:hypothetical protein EXN66_Car013150 [Channa argus]|uniref:Uncharacterized protein n=1 Tax=Channa argus TaxID=215402 RepID=A0A6G1Q4C4_CHAAH|nr:hypothetical protein EXN66_Car013150 [Channa argus]
MIKPLIHGIRQQLQNAKIIRQTSTEVNRDNMTDFHLPNILSNQSVQLEFATEFRANSSLWDLRPSSAFVTLPSGAALLGIKVQHESRPILFFQDINEVDPSCPASIPLQH